MREFKTENEMLATRNADFKALLEDHRTNLAAMPGVLPLPAQPTITDLRNYDIQHTVRRGALVAACLTYRQKVQEIVAQHQTEEHTLRVRLQAAAAAGKAPPVTSLPISDE